MIPCRISNSETKPLFSLGYLYASDFIPPNYNIETQKSELALCFSEESKLVQLEQALPYNCLYGRYWYRSGTNQMMKDALKDVVVKGLSYCEVHLNDIWLDIASNDGTLLSFVPDFMIKIGIDPAEDSFHAEARKVCNDSIQNYFSAGVYKNGIYGDKKAKIISIIAMFYDLNDPCSFLKDIDTVMEDDGLLILQMSYTPLMVQQFAFDNICHEHVCYYSMTSMKYLLEKMNFQIVDCELNDINGGSFRIYVKKKNASIYKFKTTPFRDVANFRIMSLLNAEETNGFNTEQRYIQFFEDIQTLKSQTVAFIKEEHSKGKTIWAYGASTKGNTLLQWYGLDSTLIDAIAERSSYKWGLRTIGTNIPIYSEEEMRKKHPDYLLVLPWHFVEEFKIREKEYLNSGGKFIIPCPKFEVI